MKVTYLVTINVPDDYGDVLEPYWLLEDAIRKDFDVEIKIKDYD